jgi:hypothetical protein
MNSKDNSSNAPGGESSADYMISESGEQQKQQQTSTKGKKSGLESLTDTVKEKVMGTAKSVKEGVSSTIGTNDNADDGNLESAQVHQDRIGETSSDPTTTGPRDKVREKATDKNQDTIAT